MTTRSEFNRRDLLKGIGAAGVRVASAKQKTMQGMISQHGAAMLFPTSFGCFESHMLAVAAKDPAVRFAHCGGMWVEAKHPKNTGSCFANGRGVPAPPNSEPARRATAQRLRRRAERGRQHRPAQLRRGARVAPRLDAWRGGARARPRADPGFRREDAQRARPDPCAVGR